MVYTQVLLTFCEHTPYYNMEGFYLLADSY